MKTKTIIILSISAIVVLFIGTILGASIINALNPNRTEPVSIVSTAEPAPEPIKPQDTVPAPEPEPEPLAAPSSIDEIFLQVVHEQAPGSFAYSDQTLLELAAANCYALDSGVSISEIAQVILESDFDPQTGGVILGASIAAYCPAYQQDAENFFNQYTGES